MTQSQKPEYIFETSWEVCNMVGGIYTVLSTRARTLKESHQDRLLFIGPDVWKNEESPYFEESKSLFSDWKTDFISKTGLKIKIGRWKIHGNPIAILIDFLPLYQKKDQIYGEIWEKFGVDSLHGYGDYDEASLFGYSSGMVIESFYSFYKLSEDSTVFAHFNEWMTAFGAFYIQDKVPEIATLFTTHATTIGRSIAGNNKPLYDYLTEYNGDQMAFELNVESKHSAEKRAAHIVDCFTTVSEITGLECENLLDKKPDIITPNGFEDDFVPKGKDFDKKRKEARNLLFHISETLFGYKLEKNALFVATAGRYEYKNKGIDVFIESLKKMSNNQSLNREVVAFIMVPAHISGARTDLAKKLLDSKTKIDYWNKYTTHKLFNYQYDNVISALQWFHLQNMENEKVKVVFVPSYLNGNDGIFNKTYWDLLIGMDLTVFPSYYEPWGYTPLESVAFSVPTVTTDLSGFGQWVNSLKGIKTGVEVVHRSDYNYADVVNAIADVLLNYATKSDIELEKNRKNAQKISQQALWAKFIKHYYKAYKIAVKNRDKRIAKN